MMPRTHGFLDVSLGRGHLGNGDAVRGAGDVVHIQLLEEMHRVRIARVLSADADLQ